MVSYYFGNKNNLALEVYNEYMVAMKVKTQNIIASQFPDSDLFLRTAIEYRLQNRNCNRNKGLNRFYHELCDSVSCARPACGQKRGLFGLLIRVSGGNRNPAAASEPEDRQ